MWRPIVWHIVEGWCKSAGFGQCISQHFSLNPRSAVTTCRHDVPPCVPSLRASRGQDFTCSFRRRMPLWISCPSMLAGRKEHSRRLRFKLQTLKNGLKTVQHVYLTFSLKCSLFRDRSFTHIPGLPSIRR